MVKNTVNAFNHMEFCLVINLTVDGNRAVIWPPIIATMYASYSSTLTLLHSERPKLYTILSFLSAIGLSTR